MGQVSAGPRVPDKTRGLVYGARTGEGNGPVIIKDACRSALVYSTESPRKIRLQPILPLAPYQDPACQAGIRHGVAQDAVTQALGANQPPVVDHTGEQPDVPVGTVF